MATTGKETSNEKKIKQKMEIKKTCVRRRDGWTFICGGQWKSLLRK